MIFVGQVRNAFSLARGMRWLLPVVLLFSLWGCARRQPPSPQSIANQLVVKVFYVRSMPLDGTHIVAGMIRNPTKFNLQGIALSFKFYYGGELVWHQIRTVCVFEYLRPNDVYFFKETFYLLPGLRAWDVKVSVEDINEIW